MRPAVTASSPMEGHVASLGGAGITLLVLAASPAVGRGVPWAASDAAQTLVAMTNRPLRLLALTGYFGFFLLMLVATALQPDAYSSVRDFVSGLAAADAAHPRVMIAGFQLAAVSYLAIALLVMRTRRSVSGRLTGLLLLVAAVAISVAGFAQFDCSLNDGVCLAKGDAGLSFEGHVHGRAGTFVFLSTWLAGFTLAAAVWRSRLRWLVLAGALVQTAATVATNAQLFGWPGLFQRIDIVLMHGLPLLVACGLPPFRPELTPDQVRVPLVARERDVRVLQAQAASTSARRTGLPSCTETTHAAATANAARASWPVTAGVAPVRAQSAKWASSAV